MPYKPLKKSITLVTRFIILENPRNPTILGTIVSFK